MRIPLLLVLCASLSGCSGWFWEEAKVEPPPPPPPPADPSCYTVDLFTEVKVESPEPDVPAENRRFLGEWGAGAWNDVWCHGILVNKIYPDGRADLVEMHAPYAPWGQPATAFRRTGHIDGQGNLRLDYGTETVSYRIEGDRLIANRMGALGMLHAELKYLSLPPVPAPKPMRLALAVPPAKPGG